MPVQTNVSGQILTGIAPLHVGMVNGSNLHELLGSLPITGTVVNITQSNGGIFKIETQNLTNPMQFINSTENLHDIIAKPPSVSVFKNNNEITV